MINITLKEIFIGDDIDFFKNINFQLIKDIWIGFVLCFLIGWLSIWFGNNVKIGGVKYFDALVVAVVIGMIVRMILNVLGEKVYYKIVPGLIYSQLILIPIGIILYGAKNFNIPSVVTIAQTSPGTLVQLMITITLVFVLMFFLGKIFKLSNGMKYLLGFGSAVCGASAIAITSRLCNTEPDETSIALVTNTIAVVICLFIFSFFLLGNISNLDYADATGSLLHQTGFVKTALKDFKEIAPENPTVAAKIKSIYDYGLTIKSIRVALLLFSIPLISYLLNRKLFIPWYMIAFFIVGTYVSYASLSKETMSSISKIYSIVFTSAIAAVGINADLTKVIKKLWGPLALVLMVFMIGLATFFITGLVL